VLGCHVLVPDAFYRRYSDFAIPALGRIVAGEAKPYRYLMESIREFPNQHRLDTCWICTCAISQPI
ncbi:MAG: class I SAM-dependent methyltransferase, partial [Rhodomicrobium sp.]